MQRGQPKDNVDTEMKKESEDVEAGDKSDGESQEGPPNQDAADKEPLLARDDSILPTEPAPDKEMDDDDEEKDTIVEAFN